MLGQTQRMSRNRLPRLGRLVLAAGVGVAAALAAAGVLDDAARAAALGWITGVATFLAWTWLIIGPMSAPQTRGYATREDPTRAATDLVLVGASLASVLGVGLLLLGNADPGGGRVVDAAFGAAVVTGSWVLVHTMFTLRYADLYYRGEPGGIDFNQQQPPRYRDFAYLAFTVGMTFQVSDTELQTSEIRATVLRQALLAYLFGTVIVATTINLVVQLASNGGR